MGLERSDRDVSLPRSLHAEERAVGCFEQAAQVAGRRGAVGHAGGEGDGAARHGRGREVAGTQLDPTMVEAFIQEIDSHSPANEGDHEREHFAVYERAVRAMRLTT